MKSWYLIQTKPKSENNAKENLERQGYEVYLPLVSGRTKKRGKAVMSIQPLFSRYLFIYLSEQADNWEPIRSTVGVSSLVRFGLTPAKVPKEFIDELILNANELGIHEEQGQSLTPGDSIKIMDGLFEGYDATLYSSKPDDRVIVLLKIAEKHVKVKLEQSLIEKTNCT